MAILRSKPHLSAKHPIISVIRSSGVGTAQVRDAFDHVFRRKNLRFVDIKGESFHRYDHAAMKQAMDEATQRGDANFSHFGPGANLFKELETLFKTYGETGKGKRRHYLHSMEDVQKHKAAGQKPGEITPWEDIPEGTDLMLYEGLHGCIVMDGVNIAQYADLKIGVVPVINLEWIQKIHRDTSQRGHSDKAVIKTILRRMHDYMHYIIPQFAWTDINLQVAPVVDTSYPIIARDVPQADECVAIIRFNKPEDLDMDFPYLLDRIDRSWMSRRNTIVVPGGKMGMAMELILQPLVEKLLDARKKLARRSPARTLKRPKR